MFSIKTYKNITNNNQADYTRASKRLLHNIQKEYVKSSAFKYKKKNIIKEIISNVTKE